MYNNKIIQASQLSWKRATVQTIKTINSHCQANSNKGKIKSRHCNKFYILLLYSVISTDCICGEFSIQTAPEQLLIIIDTTQIGSKTLLWYEYFIN